MRRSSWMNFACALGVIGFMAGCAAGDRDVDSSKEVISHDATVEREVYHDTSLPLYLVAPAQRLALVDHPVKRLPRPGHPAPDQDTAEELEPSGFGPAIGELAPTNLANFDGIGNG